MKYLGINNNKTKYYVADQHFGEGGGPQIDGKAGGKLLKH